MSALQSILNAPWVGTVVGMVGIVLAIVFYLRRRETKRLAYQTRGTRLIGGSSAALPPDVVVTLRGVVVPRLSKTTLFFWNAGSSTVRGADIVTSDPLRIQLDGDAMALDTTISRMTRPVTAPTTRVNLPVRNEVLLGFDFLDPQDGFSVEVIHSGTHTKAEVLGTVRGLPDGLVNCGRIPQFGRLPYLEVPGWSGQAIQITLSKGPAIALVALGTVAIVSGLFPNIPLYIFPTLGKADSARPLLTPGHVNWVPLIAGLVYAFPGAVFLWARRRRFPRVLADDHDAPTSRRASST